MAWSAASADDREPRHAERGQRERASSGTDMNRLSTPPEPSIVITILSYAPI
jgi:hypothetical protein